MALARELVTVDQMIGLPSLEVKGSGSRDEESICG